jgi:L-rhamnonate dehydratase
VATVKTIRAFYAPPATWHSPYQQYFGQFCVEITTTCGKLGLGVGGGGLASIEIVNRALAPLLQGTKAEPSEGIWDQMHDTCSPYGQKGIAIMAISAVDLALWDLKGKIEGLPVCDLISSGSSERRIKVYITTNDIERNLELGFDAFKITPIAGPGDGEIGKSRNVEYVRKVRDKLGPERKLMLDCWMSWTVDYTVEMAKRLSSFKLNLPAPRGGDSKAQAARVSVFS